LRADPQRTDPAAGAAADVTAASKSASERQGVHDRSMPTHAEYQGLPIVVLDIDECPFR
jgi:hypothetical protein